MSETHLLEELAD